MNLKDHTVNGLPIMDQQTFETLTNDVGKEKFREALAEFIAENRPEFPLKKILAFVNFFVKS